MLACPVREAVKNVVGLTLTLQHLEVCNVGIFRVDVKLDPGHGDIQKDAVEDLT